MSGPAPSLGRFVVRVLLWLPACFVAWHFAAAPHAAAAGWLANLLVDAFAPGVVTALERSGTELAFVTTLEVHPAPGRTALLLPDVEARFYTYGIALFCALMLAARTGAWRLLAGAALLLPFQAWGIAFDFLAQVAIKLGPAVSAQAGLQGWREAIALGYQAGNLIFPTLAPVALWAALSTRFIEALLPAPLAGPLGARPASRPGPPLRADQ